jgi:hypothetical protein
MPLALLYLAFSIIPNAMHSFEPPLGFSFSITYALEKKQLQHHGGLSCSGN